MSGRRGVSGSFIVGLLIAVLLLAAAGAAQAASPSISSLAPLAIPPGQTVTYIARGENLQKVKTIWTSFPVLNSQLISAENDKAEFQLTISSNVSYAFGAIRLGSPEGVSNPRVVILDDLRTEQLEKNTPGPAGSFQARPPLAIEGNIAELEFTYVKFNARAGQQFSFEVAANRLGSQLDPVLRLLDSQGRELSYIDDDPGAGSDPRFVYQFSEAGEYTLELRDLAYNGGANYFYRLRIGQFPLVTTAFPLAGKPDSDMEFEFAGPRAGARQANTIRLPQTDRAVVAVPLLPLEEGGGLGFARIFVSPHSEHLEKEPNDGLDNATPLSWAEAIHGRFLVPGDADVFSFQAEAAGEARITGESRSLGSPCDLRLTLLDGGRKILAEGNPASTNQIEFTHKFSQAGLYYLKVEELTGRGGSTLAYRVKLAKAGPSIKFTTETDRLEVRPGQKASLKIALARRNYDGPITLRADAAGRELKIQPSEITERKSEVEIEVAPPEDARPGEIIPFRLFATISGSGEEILCSTAPALRKLFPLMLQPLAELDGWLVLGVLEEKRPE